MAKEQLNVHIGRERIRKFHKWCVDNDTNMKQYIEKMIDNLN